MVGKYLLLDGYNLAFRAYYGMPELQRDDGMPTQVVHGWVRTVWMLEDQQRPTGILGFFDLGPSTERQALLAEYKANRVETPEALTLQIPWVKRLTAALGIPVVEKEGIEADDLIAGAALQLAEQGDEALMVSSDKDLAQVVRPGIRQLLPPPTANPGLGWRILDEAAVKAKFGVRPGLIADFLALTGDSSDNIRGLSGVGPKTAAKWLAEHGNLESILERAEHLQPPRFRTQVREMADALRRNLKMVSLDTSHAVTGLVPRTKFAVETAVMILEELGMKQAARQCRERYRPED